MKTLFCSSALVAYREPASSACLLPEVRQNPATSYHCGEDLYVTPAPRTSVESYNHVSRSTGAGSAPLMISYFSTFKDEI
jgi:hypothetical protein